MSEAEVRHVLLQSALALQAFAVQMGEHNLGRDYTVPPVLQQMSVPEVFGNLSSSYNMVEELSDLAVEQELIGMGTAAFFLQALAHVIYRQGRD